MPSAYHQQFQHKLELSRQDLALFDFQDIEAFASPASGFRMRAEFKIWHEGERCWYAMYQPNEYKQPVKIDQFTIGYRLIQSLMPQLLEAINAQAILKSKLFSVEFLSSTLDEAVVTLLYHRALDEEWLTAAKDLAARMRIRIIGRSRKQKLLTHNDFVTERMELSDREFTYKQTESSFTQPNAFICREMLAWAKSVTKELSGDLLELYCGNANFTVPLSYNFRKVLATEISKQSVKDALHNLKQNRIENVAVVRMSSEEFEQAANGTRAFRRLADNPLDDYHFSTVFVDPPRAGLDAKTCQMLSRFRNIVYVSCNPLTLINNLHELTKTHSIAKAAFFDQFPYTNHRELGVLLKSR